nr:MAG TPA: hypothetical protein [Caudoviricetes sp.]
MTRKYKNNIQIQIKTLSMQIIISPNIMKITTQVMMGPMMKVTKKV